MSHTNSPGNGVGGGGAKKPVTRFTTTATINCAAYPADPVTATTDTNNGKWRNNNSIGNSKLNNNNNNNNKNSSVINGNWSNGGVANNKFSNGNGNWSHNNKGNGSLANNGKMNQGVCSTLNKINSSQNNSAGGYRFGAKKFSIDDTDGSSEIDGHRSSPNKITGSNGTTANGAASSNAGGVPPPPPPPAPPLPNFRSFNGNGNNLTSTLNRRTKAPSQQPASSSSSSSYNSLPRGFVASTNKQNNTAAAAQSWSTEPKKEQPNNISSSSIYGKQPLNTNPMTVRRADSSNVTGKPKVDTTDPQVRKLVYNMYRGLLDKKHDHSNNIINNLPDLQVDRDEGVKDRLLHMMKQQEELKAGKIRAMNGPAGPPPPPPPPPFLVPGATPPLPVEPAPSMKRGASSKLSSAPQIPQATPPAALAGAMMKDKKPFTYTPGGLDLSEISPGVNGPATVPEGPPMQSRSFRILQNVVDSEASEPPSAATGGPKMRTQQQPPQQQSRVAGGSGAIPSRAFRALQQHTDVAGPGESDL